MFFCLERFGFSTHAMQIGSRYVVMSLIALLQVHRQEKSLLDTGTRAMVLSAREVIRDLVSHWMTGITNPESMWFNSLLTITVERHINHSMILEVGWTKVSRSMTV